MVLEILVKRVALVKSARVAFGVILRRYPIRSFRHANNTLEYPLHLQSFHPYSGEVVQQGLSVLSVKQSPERMKTGELLIRQQRKKWVSVVSGVRN